MRLRYLFIDLSSLSNNAITLPRILIYQILRRRIDEITLDLRKVFLHLKEELVINVILEEHLLRGDNWLSSFSATAVEQVHMFLLEGSLLKLDKSLDQALRAILLQVAEKVNGLVVSEY